MTMTQLSTSAREAAERKYPLEESSPGSELLSGFLNAFQLQKRDAFLAGHAHALSTAPAGTQGEAVEYAISLFQEMQNAGIKLTNNDGVDMVTLALEKFASAKDSLSGVCTSPAGKACDDVPDGHERARTMMKGGEAPAADERVTSLVEAAHDVIGMHRKIFCADPKPDGAVGYNGALYNLVQALRAFEASKGGGNG